MQILIVDDSDVGRLMLSVGIGELAACEEAVNGAEAVSKFTEALEAGNPYNLVFMDVIMPEMDGKEALKAIRRLETERSLARTPVYMVSASETLDGVEGLADGLMRKPASKKQLREIIQNM